MKMLKISLHTGFLILFFACVVSAENYNALIFNRVNGSLIKIPSEISEDEKCGTWASACPAKDDDVDEKEFNEEKSLYKNALFVRDIYDGENLTDLKLKICDKPFQTSVVSLNEEPFYYDFGYEIYQESSISIKYAAGDKTKYLSLVESLTKMASQDYIEEDTNLEPSTEKDEEMIESLTKMALQEEMEEDPNLEPSTKKYKEMDFFWISLFKVRFKSGNLQRIEYEIREYNIKPTMQCQNFDLAKEIFKNIDVDEFYSEEAEKNALRGVEIPNGLCTSESRCFEKWLLISADQFQFGSTELPICSNMTTIPIWSNLVKDLLKRVDQYLYILSQVSGKTLHVIAGVHEILQLKTKRARQRKYIILKSKPKNLPNLRVPSIIYKLVKFKTHNTCEDENAKCWKGVLIVIHNDPNFKYASDKVCDDVSIDLGWETLTYESLDAKDRYENMYVCEITKSSIEGVGLTYDEEFPVRELSLEEFEKGIFIELLREAEPELSYFWLRVQRFINDDNEYLSWSDHWRRLMLDYVGHRRRSRRMARLNSS